MKKWSPGNIFNKKYLLVCSRQASNFSIVTLWSCRPPKTEIGHSKGGV
jgi:hypothetical protein